MLFVDEAQQAGMPAYVAINACLNEGCLTVQLGDPRQTRGATGNDELRSEALDRLAYKRVGLRGLHSPIPPQAFSRSAGQIL